MTKNQLLRRLRKISRENEDIEHSHSLADDLLLQFISEVEPFDNGKIKEAFESIDKWYS